MSMRMGVNTSGNGGGCVSMVLAPFSVSYVHPSIFNAPKGVVVVVVVVGPSIS